MTITVKKGISKKKLNEVLRKMKHTKKLNAKRHLGKVKWGKDALEYQKKLRDEWNQYCLGYQPAHLFTQW